MFEMYRGFLHASRIMATIAMPPSRMPGQNKMAAIQCVRVPSLRGYRDSLSAENRQMYDKKLKFSAGIDPYLQAMEEWPEIKFPDIVNYLLFSTSKFTKEQLKAYNSLQFTNTSLLVG